MAGDPRSSLPRGSAALPAPSASCGDCSGCFGRMCLMGLSLFKKKQLRNPCPLSLAGILKFYPRSCSLRGVCLKVTSVFFLGLPGRMSDSQKGSGLTCSSAGNKGSAVQAILRLGRQHAAHPGEGSCLLYKALLSNQFLFRKQRGHQKQ